MEGLGSWRPEDNYTIDKGNSPDGQWNGVKATTES